mgnify:CR=1 FL=1
MATARLIPPLGRSIGPATATAAQSLARVLPRLALQARQVSAQVSFGIHGRRRAGPGETFWQFRPFMSGEPADRIDWRRSARDDRLYVREREWEVASTYWLWIDLSASMNYASSLALQSKRDRAIITGLAMADLLVRSGERVGLIGLTTPIVSRSIIARLADALVLSTERHRQDFPLAAPPGPRDRVILIGDFILPADTFASQFRALTARGAPGIAVQVRDPAEAEFPFSGETEFFAPDEATRWRVGDAGDMQKAYRERIGAHEAALRQACISRGWTFYAHSTGHPATEGVMNIAMLLSGGAGGAR